MLLKHNIKYYYMSFTDKRASKNDLTNLGITNAKVHWNLSSDELQKHALNKDQAKLTSQGAITINTGKFTGRSPLDRFIVKDVVRVMNDQVNKGKLLRAAPRSDFPDFY